MSKKSNPFGNLKKGALHKQLGYAQGTKIPLAALETASRSKDAKLAKRAQFALNARGFKH